MKPRSLRRRLLLAAIAATLAALTIAGFALSLTFERFATKGVVRELDAHLGQLAGAVDFDNNKLHQVRNLADPRFENPLSGLYWQVNDENGPVARSRSLWDSALDLPKPLPDAAGVFDLEIDNPSTKSSLLVRGRKVTEGRADKTTTFWLTVAIDKDVVAKAHEGFVSQLIVSLAILATFLISAAWLQISIGLRPLNDLRQQLFDIQSGVADRLKGDFPEEVKRLADRFNTLHAAQNKSIERARARAGNLAHGLKTPLAVLSAESRVLRKSGQTETATEVETQIERMRRSVERELARWRERAPIGDAATAVAPATNTLVEAMKRLPRGDEINWKIDIPRDSHVAVGEDDYNDIFGNLLDNARKWASRSVGFRFSRSGDTATFVIEDDGPGVPEAARHAILKRGSKLDARKSGSGLGLAIVQDLLDLNGGTLRVENLPQSGLRVVVSIPLSRA